MPIDNCGAPRPTARRSGREGLYLPAHPLPDFGVSLPYVLGHGLSAVIIAQVTDQLLELIQGVSEYVIHQVIYGSFHFHFVLLPSFTVPLL